MKTNIILTMICLCLAQGAIVAEEPADLTKLRQEHEESMDQAIMKLEQEHLKSYMEMLRPLKKAAIEKENLVDFLRSLSGENPLSAGKKQSLGIQ